MCAKKIRQEDISYQSLLQGNKEWVAEILDNEPDYFKNLSEGQNPPSLWIGC